MNALGYGTPAPGIFPFAGFGLFVLVLIVWSIIWKGLALWRAAKRGEKIWFVVFLIVNTAGILEIIYLFLITGARFSDFRVDSSDTK